MHFETTYDLPDDDALARLRALTDYWVKKHGVKMQWDGGTVTLSGRVMGVKFDGTVRVGGGKLVADVKAGFLAEKLGAKSYVEGKLADYLDPGKSLEELRARIP